MPSLFRLLLTTVFMFAITLWTWALLEPRPVPEGIRDGLNIEWEFFLSKCLHCGAYAFLTALGGIVLESGRRSWLIVALLALHGVATEWAQFTMELGRHGCIRDVLIDWMGIAGGYAFLRWFPFQKREATETIVLP